MRTRTFTVATWNGSTEDLAQVIERAKLSTRSLLPVTVRGGDEDEEVTCRIVVRRPGIEDEYTDPQQMVKSVTSEDIANLTDINVRVRRLRRALADRTVDLTLKPVRERVPAITGRVSGDDVAWVDTATTRIEHDLSKHAPKMPRWWVGQVDWPVGVVLVIVPVLVAFFSEASAIGDPHTTSGVVFLTGSALVLSCIALVALLYPFTLSRRFALVRLWAPGDEPPTPPDLGRIALRQGVTAVWLVLIGVVATLIAERL